MDLTGQRFSRLVVVRLATPSDSGKRRWTCLCDCGTSTMGTQDSLRAGNKRSCGCLRREINAAVARSRRKPGGPIKEHPLHPRWEGMIARCCYQGDSEYKNYGARGIRVCDRWRRGEGGKLGFECFVEDMGLPPLGMTLDRIDNNGNYEPSNCRWATLSAQSANNRRAVLITYAGETMCQTFWARRLGMCCSALQSRIRKYGIELAISMGPKVRRGQKLQPATRSQLESA